MKICTNEQLVEYMRSRKQLKWKRSKPPRHGYILDAVAAFDIETSVIYPRPDDPQAIMYIWQFCVDDHVTYGREWAQYMRLLSAIQAVMPADTRLIIYVHNLSYEFQFLAGLFKFFTDDVFCLEPRSILYARERCFEYRCSYKLSNGSLFAFCEKYKVEHYKQSGETFDYLKIRYPWTPLTNFEMKYALYDVVGLVECINAEMAANGDNLYTIPLTSTGYIRRDVKKVLRDWNRRNQYFLQPKTAKLYKRLKECFRGGDTHANRFFSNMTLPAEDGPYWSRDESSDYPAQMVLRKFPMSEWKEGPEDFDGVLNLIKRHYCVLIVFIAENVSLRDPLDGFPVLSESKCRGLQDEVIDNGRILSARVLETTETDVDFNIFLDTYDADITVVESYYCKYGYLPNELRDYVISKYVDKTTLKGVDDPLAETRYMQSKARINGIYGLLVQDVLKPLIQYVDGEYREDPEFNLDDALSKNARKAYGSYSWGCWVTAWARYDLHLFRKEVTQHGGHVVYCDTDSGKGCGPCHVDEFNRRRMKDAEAAGAVAVDAKGKKHYMGIFEAEEDMKEFKTMGAKKYAYTTLPGDLHITIAGVNKKKGAAILQRAGGLDAMQEGFVFPGVASDAIYNDTPYGLYKVEGKELYISRNVALIPGDYTLGITGTYKYILEHPTVFYDVWRAV